MSVSVDLGVTGLSEGTEIGRGGFGVVYRAEQVNFGRAVAVKVLSPMALSEDVARRFEQECKAMAAVSSHPNIVALYDSGVTGGGTRPYLIMELVPGGSLAEKMPVPWERAVDFGVKLSGALETAHRIGIFHRDVKPENILLSSYGEPKLTDFGIAKIAGSTETVSGHITASILHASPEVLSGARPSVQTDVYSLASTIYALISGRAAFAGEQDEETLAPLLLRISVAAPPDLRMAGVPEEVCRVIEQAMAKESAQRPASAAEFGRQLAEAQRSLGLPVTRMLIEGEEQEHHAAAAPPANGKPATGKPATEKRVARTPPTNITPKPGGTAPEEPSAPKARRRLVVAGVAVLAVAGAGTAVALGHSSGGNGSGNHPLVAASYVVDTSCRGFVCKLTATGKNASSSTAELQWTFGDGSHTEVKSGPSISHNFRKAGHYTVAVAPNSTAAATTIPVHLVSHSRTVKATAVGRRMRVTVTSLQSDCMHGVVDLQERLNGHWVSATESGGGSSGKPLVGSVPLKVSSSMQTAKLSAGTYRAVVPQSAITDGVCAKGVSKQVRIAPVTTSGASNSRTNGTTGTTGSGTTVTTTTTPSTSTSKPPGCGGPCS